MPNGEIGKNLALYYCLQPFQAGMSTHQLAGMSPTCYSHDVSSGILDST